MALRLLAAEDQKADVAIGDDVFDDLLDADVFGEDLAADGAVAADRVGEMMIKFLAGERRDGDAAVDATQPVVAWFNRPCGFRPERS